MLPESTTFTITIDNDGLIFANQTPLPDASIYLADCIEIWLEVSALKPDHKYKLADTDCLGASFENEWLARIYNDIDEQERKLISFTEFERLFIQEVEKPVPNNFSPNELNKM
jgi:hypothetical protein